MSSFIRGMDQVSNALAVVAACFLAVATLVICWMVAYRTMGYSTSWELELGIFLMVCALFLGSPYTLKTKGHVGVDLMASMLPDRYARSLQLGVLVVGLLVVVFLAWLGFEFSLHAFEKGERTERMGALQVAALRHYAHWFRNHGPSVLGRDPTPSSTPGCPS
jgi:TRAP-type C4-dicarboxylate transport system permease small subunit